MSSSLGFWPSGQNLPGRPELTIAIGCLGTPSRTVSGETVHIPIAVLIGSGPVLSIVIGALGSSSSRFLVKPTDTYCSTH